jgi:peptidase M23-like protein
VTGRRWAIVALAACLVTMAPLIAVPLIVAVLVAGGAAADGPTTCANNTGTFAQVDAAGAGVSLADLDAKQRAVAGTIILVGRHRGIDVNGIIAALITGYQESKYLVYANDGTGGDLAPEQLGIERSLALPHDAVGTDHGSLGVFQQQWPWWGTMTELMDPQTAAEKFYAALVEKVPSYPELDPGDVAQTVQVSAYPDAYHQWEPLARQLLTHASELGGQISTSGPAKDPAATTAVSDLCGSGAAMDCAPTGLAAERGLTPDALRVLRCVDDRFGRHTYLGVGERASNPTSDHPTGRAVDIMIDRWRTRLGNVEGWRIARWVADNAAGLGVTYVIFDGRIWSTERADEGWRRYRHPSGAADPTALHRDHVHVSVAGDSAGQPGLGGRWQPPMRSGSYTVTATFGACSGLWSSCHTGIDLAAPTGTTIYAAHAGRVTTVGYDGDGYGNYTVVSVEDIDLYYAHQTSIQVRVGEVVSAGQPIGTVGATGNTTGPHLHYEIRVDDQAVDPEPFMIARGIDLRELA